MLPVLFSVGNINVYTQGLFLVLAFFWGLFLIWNAIRLTSYKEEVIFDGVFFSIIGAFFFGRIFYVMANFSKFGFSILKFILVNGYPGFSIYGALFGGLLFFFLFSLIKKLNFLEVVDYFIPGIFVALGFGKLGAFFSGSEIGTKTDFFLKVHYLGYKEARHLVGLYEALLFFLASYLSFKILFAVRRENLSQGAGLIFFLWFFSGVYFLMDPLKQNKFYFWGFNFNKWFSLFLWLTTSIILVYHFRSEIISFIFLALKNAGLFFERGFRKISKTFNRRKAKAGKRNRSSKS